jgi:flavin reductase (DIM6/NTAB) family NADH-FMN oxidoreductase RutF
MAEIAPERFRQALGNFLTGVTVVTTSGPDGEPIGMTANAFTSVSLDPPLVLVCVARSASTFAAMEQARTYAVHVLHDGQDAISMRFACSAADGIEKFSEIEWYRADSGLPLLDDALARLECTIVDRVEMGDHVGYVGRVDAAHAPERMLAPLAFYRGSYARLAG